MKKQRQGNSLRRPLAWKRGTLRLNVMVQLEPGKDEIRVEANLETVDRAEADARAGSIVKILESILMYKRPAGRISSFFID